MFCVAGAALSMAYYDLFIIDVATLLPLREMFFVKKTEACGMKPSPAVVPH